MTAPARSKHVLSGTVSGALMAANVCAKCGEQLRVKGCKGDDGHHRHDLPHGKGMPVCCSCNTLLSGSECKEAKEDEPTAAD